MNIMKLSMIALVLGAAVIAGCKDQLPTDPQDFSTHEIFYTGLENPTDRTPIIFTVRPDGSNRHKVIEGGVMTSRPFGRLLYTTQGPNFYSSIMIANMSGTGNRSLAPNLEAIYPALSTMSANRQLVSFTVDDSLLYVVNTDGTDLRLIAENAVHETKTVVSPDGKWVAYYGKGDSKFNPVWLASTEGRPRRLAAGNGINLNDFEGGICWSRDGLRIFYLGLTLGGETDIFSAELLSGATFNITRDAAEELTPELSPDGTKLLYNAYRFNDGDITDSDIWVVGTDGSGKRNVTESFTAFPIKGYPTWSPEGDNILFTAAPEPLEDGATGVLYRMPLAGGRAIELARNVWMGYWVSTWTNS